MDLENERKPIRPQKSGKNASRANELTGMVVVFVEEGIMFSCRDHESAIGGILPGHGDGTSNERSREAFCAYRHPRGT